MAFYLTPKILLTVELWGIRKQCELPTLSFCKHIVLHFLTFSSFIQGNLTSFCNTDCNCVDAYDPVCGSDNIMYYSSCHAGCAIELDPASNGNKVR